MTPAEIQSLTSAFEIVFWASFILGFLVGLYATQLFEILLAAFFRFLRWREKTRKGSSP